MDTPRRVTAVVLDGHTLNPGDLDWAAIGSQCELTVFPRTDPAQVLDRAAGAAVLFVNKVPLDRGILAKLTDLRYVGVLATGFNVVDVAAAREQGVVVTNVPAYGTRSVAQFTFGLILELCHQIGHHAQTVEQGRWSNSPDFSYWDARLVELDGLTLGIYGYGNIGQAVARIGRAFGMNVVAHTRTPGDDAGVEFVGMEELFKRSDVLTLHAPLTPENDGFVDARRLALMKPTAFLVNTARGQLINEADLARALEAGQIAGAALDVLRIEPPRDDNPLLRAKNCLITPHMAWATHAARSRLMEVAASNLAAFLAGHPVNVVNAG